MKYVKPEVEVMDFIAMEHMAYIPENNGAKAKDEGSTNIPSGFSPGVSDRG